MTRILTLLLATAALASPALAQGGGNRMADGQMPGQHFIENWDEDGDGR